jgi:predicted transcriptional regulator
MGVRKRLRNAGSVPPRIKEARATDDQTHLTRRERQIMDIVYKIDGATVNHIQSRLPNAPTHTAVRTLLTILEQKGQVTRSKRGRENVYTAAKPRKSAGRSALRRVINTFFDGSFEGAVAAHLSQRSGRLTDKELKRIADLIADARKRGS